MHIHSCVLVRPLGETPLLELSRVRSEREQDLSEEKVLAQSLFNRLHPHDPSATSMSQPLFGRRSTGLQATTELRATSSANASPGWYGGDGIPDEFQEEWDKFWHRLIYEFWAYKPFENNPNASLAGNWTYVGGYRVGLDGYIHIGDNRFYYEIGVRNTTMWDIAIFAVSLVLGVGVLGLIGGDVIGYALTKGAEWLADWLVDDEKTNSMVGAIPAVSGSGFAEKLGGELSLGFKSVGMGMSQSWKDAAGGLTEEVKQVGDVFSQNWKDTGGAISRGWKSAGSSISGGWKKASRGFKL